MCGVPVSCPPMPVTERLMRSLLQEYHEAVYQRALTGMRKGMDEARMERKIDAIKRKLEKVFA